MFAEHALRKSFLFIVSLFIFFLSISANAFDVDETSFKVIKQQYKRISDIKTKLDEVVKYCNILNFEKRTNGFIKGILGRNELIRVGKEIVLFVNFYEDNFSKNLVSNISFNIFGRCLFKILSGGEISKHELEALIDNLIVVINIEHYKKANENIHNTCYNLVIEDINKNTEMIDFWQKKACKVLNSKKGDMVFAKEYIIKNFKYIEAANMKNLAYSSNTLGENFKEVLEEIVVFSDMFIGMIISGCEIF